MTDRPWPEDTNLSVYGRPPVGAPPEQERNQKKADGPRGAHHRAGVVPVAPDKAYRGMPPDVALAGAVCDALIWGKESWTADIQKQQEAPPPILMSSDNERIMAAYGWRDAEDIYEAAGLTERQRRAVALHLLGWEFAEIASEMRNSRWTVRTHVDVGTDKLHKLVHASSPIYIQGADRAE